MKKALWFASFFLCGLALFAAPEVFESPVFKKEVQQVYGSGALSVATNSYSILVWNKTVYMKIEVPKKAFDLLKVGDVVRVTYERGLVMNEIKALALVHAASDKDPAPKSPEEKSEEVQQ